MSLAKDAPGRVDLATCSGPAHLEAIADQYQVPLDDVERELEAAGWHLDAWGIAWPPGVIEQMLREYPDSAAGRDERINVFLRAVGMPETRLYLDMLKRIEGGQ